ncbi:TIR domain-containing protein [Parafrankia colletiae]|uniref:TIR domain-containing protein n=1 Tax=Parafrankia colletiae TaxID=573497 RepID=UPI000AD37379|nr:TIR domain-containing protein [Parafrankia colletiae]
MTDEVRRLRRLRVEDVAELANVFYEPRAADQLLAQAGFSRGALPAGYTAAARWEAVNDALGDGLVEGGRLRILELAQRLYPANTVFGAGLAEARRAEVRLTAGDADADADARPTRPESRHGTRGRLPLPGTVIVLDAVGYSRNGVMVQLGIRDGLRDIVNDALADARIPASAVTRQDTGDGLVAVVSGDVPKAVIAADFVEEVRRGLRSYNRTRTTSGRIRLRLSLHHGDVVKDRTGWAGDAVIVGCRLIDSPPIRAVFTANPSVNLAVIMSSEFYGDTTAQELLGLDPGAYREVDVRVPKFSGTAWLTVPGERLWTLEAPDDGDGIPAPTPATSTAGAGSGDTLPDNAVRWDFLIAAAEEDEGWGAWIAHALEKDKAYKVHIETWDIQAADNVTWQLQEAMAVAERTIVIVSANLAAHPRAQAVWMEAWRNDPAGQGRSVVPVIVGDYQPAGLLAGIKPIRLSGTDSGTDEKELREQIQRVVDGHYRPPTQPPYPGVTNT